MGQRFGQIPIFSRNVRRIIFEWVEACDYPETRKLKAKRAMAHFQLVPSLPNVKDHTRCWVKGATGDEQFVLHLNAKVTLQQWGNATDQSTPPQLYSDNSAVAEISNENVHDFLQDFAVEGKSPGQALLNGKRPWTDTTNGMTLSVDDVYPLKVFVGDFKDHAGMSVDLLAKSLGRSNNPFKILSLIRLLNNNADNANLFHQQSARNVGKFGTPLACGDVAADAGHILLGRVSTTYSSYHIPLRSISSRDDVKYDPATMSRARAAIQGLLTHGTAVRVGTAHHATTSMLRGGALQPTSGGGHFVLIVGCDATANKFLYVDPWFGGSRLAYQGGVAGSPSRPTAACQFMGMFETDTASTRGPVLRQTSGSEGSFNTAGGNFLEVIAGPL